MKLKNMQHLIMVYFFFVLNGYVFKMRNFIT